jgi:hypothetical protein
VNLDAMLSTDCEKLFLKRHLSVVFRPAVNVSDDILDQWLANQANSWPVGPNTARQSRI